jgi:serine/threonine protein kinase
MLDVIGEGSYGLICTCKHTLQNKVYAIKFLEVDGTSFEV